ncbi:hypothetical protein [Leptospirillum ferriphilum]|jgi:hypothetical protein|uniref:Uncharacterized protein n=1 Tax=Leptospirillum ferriphilum (strain ML-04) TaxID=1048260 RepID=J9ZG71_LEPFM|nr:hypothetical protein [Leptospirillum ferriphilum]AFS54632.1 hypothetical protein LFML04_2443 [Leptospirillum ferriphilum ML-04]
MEVIALVQLRVKSTGAEYLPGERVDAAPEKLREWAERGLVRVVKQEAPLPVVVASDGRVLAWTNDPPHIRVYAWVLQTLRFIPVDAQTSKILKIPSGEMDATRLRKLARDLRMTDQELQAALSQLVREKDLEFRTDRGRRIYFLAPLRY